jgi:hypothetical protein
LSFVQGQHEEENDNEQFYIAMQSKRKLKKLTRGGRLQSTVGNIGDGNGAMELTPE